MKWPLTWILIFSVLELHTIIDLVRFHFYSAALWYYIIATHILSVSLELLLQSWSMHLLPFPLCFPLVLPDNSLIPNCVNLIFPVNCVVFSYTFLLIIVLSRCGSFLHSCLKEFRLVCLVSAHTGVCERARVLNIVKQWKPLCGFTFDAYCVIVNK